MKTNALAADRKRAKHCEKLALKREAQLECLRERKPYRHTPEHTAFINAQFRAPGVDFIAFWQEDLRMGLADAEPQTFRQYITEEYGADGWEPFADWWDDYLKAKDGFPLFFTDGR